MFSAKPCIHESIFCLLTLAYCVFMQIRNLRDSKPNQTSGLSLKPRTTSITSSAEVRTMAILAIGTTLTDISPPKAIITRVLGSTQVTPNSSESTRVTLNRSESTQVMLNSFGSSRITLNSSTDIATIINSIILVSSSRRSGFTLPDGNSKVASGGQKTKLFPFPPTLRE